MAYRRELPGSCRGGESPAVSDRSLASAEGPMARSAWLWGVIIVLTSPGTGPAIEPDDPFLWLEEIAGERPLEWVKRLNTESTAALADSDEFRALERRLLAILDSDERIPYVQEHGGRYYNFWRDARNRRGVRRRTTLEEYRKERPAWETVLDLDALAEAEGENWVWHGA